ncbi:capsid [Circovirus sp.]|nr:capsid [Circovirus sp.]
MGLDIRPIDFDEFGNLAPNFEAYRFTRCRVRILPQQNVSNNSTSLVPSYCLFPWHRPMPEATTFNAYLSIDRAKIFRATGVGKMTFVPSVLNSLATADGKGYTLETKFKPRIELVNNDSAYNVVFYTGGLGFQGIPDGEKGAKAHYNIVIDMWCTFYNQKTLK